MPPLPKFDATKLKKYEERHLSPHHEEKEAMLRSKELRMAAIRRANNIRRSVRNQIIEDLVVETRPRE